ncbi:hypothetical protein ACFYUK_18655 [Nonomuraea wenchangensis]
MPSNSDDLELAQARILGARNSSSLPVAIVTAVQKAEIIGATSIEVSRGTAHVIFRHYTVTCSYVTSKEVETTKRDGSKERVVETINHEKTVNVWEVCGCRHAKNESPGSWVYTDPRSAASSLSYLLMTHTGMWSEGDTEEIVDLRDILGRVLQRSGIRTTGTIPSVPTDDADTKATTLASLAATAIDARQKDVSPATRKRIAIALYLAGESNIRHISYLTGLSRETIYKALHDEHIKQ